MTISVEPALSMERPFPGLRPFTYADREFFFGREEQTYALYRLIDRGRFLAVVGSSGSGKSSLVRAGLRALLQEESADATGRKWIYREMRPGAAPLSGLADALAGLSKDEDEDIAAARKARIDYRLRQSSFGMAEALAEIEGLEDASLLLVVDQFEELFRYAVSGATRNRRDDARSRDEAAQFVQILLEVARKQAGNVHVLLTMRSDFIGDCARFHGLPEAVSASQFLVPSLTRDQLEEVIREPVNKAGATIEPALVERLLNDSGNEPDQLPVLQHCLLRLWERAGTEAKARQGEDRGESRPVGPGTPHETAPSANRNLTLGDYQGIGSMTGALSRHADEILASLSVREIAVEQVMRALAEIDREGRAIRRALPFSQLRDETGISTEELVQILDRFRADDCSFLTPSLSAAPTLAPGTPIDVGHEALLRRWRKVSGDPDAPSAQYVDVASVGWLRAEEYDGHSYRALLSMLGNDGRPGATLPLHLVNNRWQWWTSRPRTQAWAERYGGRFEQVRQLLQDSVAALEAEQKGRRRDALIRRSAFAAFALLALVVAGLGYAVRQQSLTASRQSRYASESFNLVVNSAQKFLDQILVSYNTGTISAQGAQDLAKTAESVAAQVRYLNPAPESKALLVKLLEVEHDLSMVLGDVNGASKYASDAKRYAQELVASDRTNPKWLQLLFASSTRVGDGLAAHRGDKDKVDAAFQEYEFALATAQQLATIEPDEGDRQLNIGQTHVKLGDIMYLKAKYREALEEYDAAAAIGEALIAKDPKRTDWQRLRATAQIRIGQARTALKEWDLAYASFQSGLATQEALLRLLPADYVIQSNIAASHTRLGDFWKQQKKYENALAEYKLAIGIFEDLARKDQSNTQWQSFLAPNYENAAKLLDLLKMPAEATEFYRKAFALRREYVARNLSSVPGQQYFLASTEALAEHLTRPEQASERLELYRAALQMMETIAKSEPDSPGLQNRLFVSHGNIGDTLASQGDWDGALAEYEEGARDRGKARRQGLERHRMAEAARLGGHQDRRCPPQQGRRGERPRTVSAGSFPVDAAHRQCPVRCRIAARAPGYRGQGAKIDLEELKSFPGASACPGSGYAPDGSAPLARKAASTQDRS